MRVLTDKQTDLKELWNEIAGKNDGKSFERFFFILNPRLIKFCELYVYKKEIAEEIVSDVFVNFWHQRLKLAHIENPETYIFISVKNRALNHLRKHAGVELVRLEEQETEPVTFSNPETEIEKKELFFKLDQAIETLPQQCKIIFQLVKEDGMRYREVAEILNISPKTVQTQVFRAMKRLSKEMSPYLTIKSFLTKFV